MSSLFVLQSWDFALMLADRIAISEYGVTNMIVKSTTKLFQINRNLYAGGLGHWGLYVDGLNRVSEYLKDLSRVSSEPMHELVHPENIAAVVRVQLQEALLDCQKNKPVDSKDLPTATLALLAVGEMASDEDRANGKYFSIYRFRSETDFAPDKISGFIQAYDNDLSGLAIRIWEDPLAQRIRRMGALSQAQLLKGIHHLCHQMTMLVSEEYDLIYVGKAG
jgi:hypothetical protein